MEISLDRSYQDLKSWLNQGELFDKDGAIFSWNDPTDTSEPFKYSEITGYFLTLTSYLYKLNSIDQQHNIYRQAKKSVNWLKKNYNKEISGFPFKNDEPISYSFDNTIIAFGLISFYKITKDKDAYHLAKLILDNFLTTWFKEDNLSARKNFEGKITDCKTTWSSKFGSFHAKANLALISMYELTKESKYREGAERLSKTILKKFYNESVFNSYEEEGTHLHPLIYTIEGLLFKDLRLNERNYITEIQDSLQWIYSKNGNQLFRSIYLNNLNAHMRVDIYFQLLRILEIIEDNNYCKLPNFNKSEILKNAAKYKCSRNIYTFGKSSKGDKIPHQTSWVNFMATQYFANRVYMSNSLALEFYV